MIIFVSIWNATVENNSINYFYDFKITCRGLAVVCPLYPLYFALGCNKAVLFASFWRHRNEWIFIYFVDLFICRNTTWSRAMARKIYLRLYQNMRERERAYEICLSEIIRWLTIVLWQSLKYYAIAQAHMQRLGMPHTRNMFINIVFLSRNRESSEHSSASSKKSTLSSLILRKENENQVPTMR